jgi:hypothetical protein
VHHIHNSYGGHRSYAGVTLQRAQFVPVRGGEIQYIDRVRVFFYKLVGSWGYSPSSRDWYSFIEWYRNIRKTQPAFRPYVEGLIPTEWYKSFEASGDEDTMWTMWYIYYMNASNKWTVYANAPGGTTFGSCWQEPGMHVLSGGAKRDFVNYDPWYFSLEDFKTPEDPIRYNVPHASFG